MRQEIEKALKVLNDGGTILYPTDTIWGIGCLATDPVAVQKVYDIKKRADTKSMLVLLDHENRLLSYVDVVPDIAWELSESTDKPLTIIYPGAKNLADNLLPENKSDAISTR